MLRPRPTLLLETRQGTQGGAQQVLVLRDPLHVQRDRYQRDLLPERRQENWLNIQDQGGTGAA